MVTTCRIMMKFCKVCIWRMANTVVTFMFQISYATPITRLLIRVISDLKFNFNYSWVLDEIFYIKQLKDDNYSGDNDFSNSYATPIIMLLIRVISDLKFNFNYLWDLDEMFYTKQLKDGECNGDNYFSNFWCHAYN